MLAENLLEYKHHCHQLLCLYTVNTQISIKTFDADVPLTHMGQCGTIG